MELITIKLVLRNGTTVVVKQHSVLYQGLHGCYVKKLGLVYKTTTEQQFIGWISGLHRSMSSVLHRYRGNKVCRVLMF